jgi:hypothetical protein
VECYPHTLNRASSKLDVPTLDKYVSNVTQLVSSVARNALRAADPKRKKGYAARDEAVHQQNEWLLQQPAAPRPSRSRNNMNVNNVQRVDGLAIGAVEKH